MTLSSDLWRAAAVVGFSTALVVGALAFGVAVVRAFSAASDDEWTEADELREDENLARAIAEWKASVIPYSPEQEDAMWEKIEPHLTMWEGK